MGALVMTLGEFIRHLFLHLEKSEVTSLLKEDGRILHVVLYEIQETLQGVRGRPEFLDGLVFNWDGPTPRSPELDEFLFGLVVSGAVELSSPSFKRGLPTQMRELWERGYRKALSLDPDLGGFMQEAVEVVRISLVED